MAFVGLDRGSKKSTIHISPTAVVLNTGRWSAKSSDIFNEGTIFNFEDTIGFKVVDERFDNAKGTFVNENLELLQGTEELTKIQLTSTSDFESFQLPQVIFRNKDISAPGTIKLDRGMISGDLTIDINGVNLQVGDQITLLKANTITGTYNNILASNGYAFTAIYYVDANPNTEDSIFLEVASISLPIVALNRRIETKKPTAGFKITVSPNPTQGQVNISKLVQKVQVFSMEGALVFETIKSSFDISKLSRSTYVLVIHTGGDVIKKRLVLN